jgi:protein AaeX
LKYTEIDLLGVYIAPISLSMLGAWLATILFSRAAVHFGLLRHVWHPALFLFSVYMIALSSIVLMTGR